MSKVVNLKNGLKAELHLEKNKNIFYIYATAGNYKKVAFCTFCLSYKIEQILTDQERLDYANKHNIPFEETPSTINKYVDDSKIAKTNGILLKTTKGKIYKVAETTCHLDKIEIIDEKFYKVGLGTKMIKAMESIISKYNCSYIEGLFSPFGKFQNGSELFYDRNNFTIYEDTVMDGIKFLYKECKAKQNLIEC